jgi:hypothetical protein
VANELLFAITDGDMTQMRAWDELEIHDFFAKLEAYKSHMHKKRPQKDEKDLYTKVEK